MCEGTERASALVTKLETCCVTPDKITRLDSFQGLLRDSKNCHSGATCSAFFRILTKAENCINKWTIMSIVAAIIAVILHFELHTLQGFARFWLYWENIDLQSEQCTVDIPSLVQDSFRPPVDCSMCAAVTSVHRVSNISPATFEAKYAYSGRPVVVADGQRSWSAPDVFSFEFFKRIYGEDSPVLFNLDRECQFFPYLTSFNNLKEVFNMSRDRLKVHEDNVWYVGWSNCDSAAANILREHYEKPYFLPATSESTKTDWIFMGTPGHGAHLHIDHVGKPSWQAQIQGRKRWTLVPPPECYFHCSSLEVIVHPGEIIVLDTNIWYHGTYILPGELSITIGSEYD